MMAIDEKSGDHKWDINVCSKFHPADVEIFQRGPKLWTDQQTLSSLDPHGYYMLYVQTF